MPAAAHFQVAKTISDFLRDKTKQNTLPTRREMVAELRPIMTLLKRKESTCHAMIDVLMRIGAIKNERGYYSHVRSLDLAAFAAEVDRNNPRIKMVITYKYNDVDQGDVTISIENAFEFTDDDVQKLFDSGIKAHHKSSIKVGSPTEVYELTGKAESLRNYLRTEMSMTPDEVDDVYPCLASMPKA